MSNKRLWIALAAIPISLASLLILGAQRSHPASAGGVIDPTCTSPSPCIQYMNNSSGPGVEGLSLLGNGLFGVTKFKSSSASNGKSGLFGSDQSTSGSFDAGVRGLSVRGIGVAGQSTSGAGISATSSSGDAIDAASSSGEGLHATSKSSPAVDGTSQSSDGVIGSGPNAGVQGVGPNVGVLGRSFNLGVAVESDNRDGVGVLASGGGSDTSGALYPALAVNGNNFNPDLIYTCSYGMLSPCRTGAGLPAPLFAAVNNGNVFITGTIHTAGSCSSGCAATATIGERRVRLFTPQESLPTIEDFGQGAACCRSDLCTHRPRICKHR